MLFRRKDKPPKDTHSVEFKRYVAAKLNGRSIRYILERSDNTDRVIGKGRLYRRHRRRFCRSTAAKKTLFFRASRYA